MEEVRKRIRELLNKRVSAAGPDYDEYKLNRKVTKTIEPVEISTRRTVSTRASSVDGGSTENSSVVVEESSTPTSSFIKVTTTTTSSSVVVEEEWKIFFQVSKAKIYMYIVKRTLYLWTFIIIYTTYIWIFFSNKNALMTILIEDIFLWKFFFIIFSQKYFEYINENCKGRE